MLRSLEPELMLSIRSIRRLNLSFNFIENIPKEVLYLKHLQELDIIGNPIFSLSLEMFHLGSLQKINFEWSYYSGENLTTECDKEIGLSINKIRNYFPAGARGKLNYAVYYNVVCGKRLRLSIEATQSYISLAIKKKHLGFYIYLVTHYPSALDLNGDGGNCFLIEAIDSCNLYLVTDLLKRSKLEGNTPITLMGSPLHYCVKNFVLDSEIISILIQNSIDPNGLDSLNRTPLHYIFKYYKRDPCRFKEFSLALLEVGANPNIRDNAGMSPLLYAAKQGNKEAVYLATRWNESLRKSPIDGLLAFDFDIRSKVSGMSLLHYVCRIPSLILIAETTYEPSCKALRLNRQMKIAEDLVPGFYLSSTKIARKATISALLSRFKPDSSQSKTDRDNFIRYDTETHEHHVSPKNSESSKSEDYSDRLLEGVSLIPKSLICKQACFSADSSKSSNYRKRSGIQKFPIAMMSSQYNIFNTSSLTSERERRNNINILDRSNPIELMFREDRFSKLSNSFKKQLSKMLKDLQNEINGYDNGEIMKMRIPSNEILLLYPRNLYRKFIKVIKLILGYKPLFARSLDLNLISPVSNLIWSAQTILIRIIKACTNQVPSFLLLKQIKIVGDIFSNISLFGMQRIAGFSMNQKNWNEPIGYILEEDKITSDLEKSIQRPICKSQLTV